MSSILILTQYYPPETGAPQNRLSSLARHLEALGNEVTVLTAMPNYPQMQIYDGYEDKFYVCDEIDNIRVHRLWIYVSSSRTTISRLVNYFSFVFSSLIGGLFKIKRHDIVFCESPPLFLGITALLLKWFKGSKLVFNVSDLWPESAKELGIIKNRLLLNSSKILEEAIYKRCLIITGQTQGIVKDIKTRFPNKTVHWLPNGADIANTEPRQINISWRRDNGFSESDFIVLYGGILGYAQNLEVVLRAAKVLKQERDIKFLIVGDGPNKNNLQEQQAKLNLDNVFFIPAQPASEMPAIINSCNVGVIPLRDIALFKGAIPSKIFEYLIFQKPILLGVDGEAKDLFIVAGKCGLFYNPQDHNDLSGNVIKLRNDTSLANLLGKNGATYVRQKFDRQKIAAQFHTQLNAALVE